jgi:hypothetical protein
LSTCLNPAHAANSAMTNIHRVIPAHNEVSQKDAKSYTHHLDEPVQRQAIVHFRARWSRRSKVSFATIY